MKISWVMKYSIILLTLALLTACGFHFRSESNYPKELRYLYIQSATPYGEFEQVLHDMLGNSNITIVTSPEKATAILVISTNSVNTSSNNVSSNTQLRQYLISISITFSVLTAHGAIALPPHTINLSNQYTASVNQVLGGNTEQQNLQEQMLHDAAFRLSLILGSDLTRQGFANVEKNTTAIK